MRMRKIINLILFVFFITTSYSAHAILSMELTHGVAGAIPLAVVPFAGVETAPQNISIIVTDDLSNSGRFKVFGRNALNQFPNDASKISGDYFRHLGTDYVVVGKVNALGGNHFQVNFQLVDLSLGKDASSIVLDKKYTIDGASMRKLAHHISDLVYEQITATRGIFSTKIAYVVVQRAAGNPVRYILEVADQDGYNPRALLSSPEPIMSPSWSPNGQQLAYVSFENRQAGIFIHDVTNGSRRLLSQFPGINGAPAWSPDGSKLAIVLSKSGSPNIYVMDIGSHALTQVTRDFYINTEPAWAPDAKSLLFSSDRGNGLQIYQVNLSSGAVSRVTYDGNYNARASYTKDGKYISMIHRVSGNYNIAMLDLDSGTIRVLNNSVVDSSSPSLAPNGSMILYDTVYGGRNVLAVVSADGRIQLRMPARNGEAQDPAWSPFLS